MASRPNGRDGRDARLRQFPTDPPAAAPRRAGMLPLAVVLGVQCWLSLTDRVTDERARAAGMLVCFLAVHALGSEQAAAGASKFAKNARCDF